MGGAPSPSGEISDPEDVWEAATVGDYAGGTAFIFFSAAICFYWTGFTLTNTIYTHEYTSLNQFNSARYNWVDWWGVWVLVWNVTLPMLLALAITFANVRVWSRIHKTFAYLTIIATIIAFVFLTIGWIGFCNRSGSGGNSACNDYRWCGFYYTDSGGWCSNGIPFPGLMSSDLARNQQMTEHWIYCFVFGLMSYFHILMNTEFRNYGILK